MREQINLRRAQVEQSSSEQARRHYEQVMRDVYGVDAEAQIRRMDERMTAKKAR